MRPLLTALYLLAALLCLLAAFGLIPVAAVGHDALFLAGVFLGWIGLERLSSA